MRTLAQSRVGGSVQQLYGKQKEVTQEREVGHFAKVRTGEWQFGKKTVRCWSTGSCARSANSNGRGTNRSRGRTGGRLYERKNAKDNGIFTRCFGPIDVGGRPSPVGGLSFRLSPVGGVASSVRLLTWTTLSGRRTGNGGGRPPVRRMKFRKTQFELDLQIDGSFSFSAPCFTHLFAGVTTNDPNNNNFCHWHLRLRKRVSKSKNAKFEKHGF